MSAVTPTRPHGRRRRGSLYITVLGAALIVTILGLSALAAVRIQRRAAEGTNDLTAARLYAQAAIEIGMHEIENSSNWRTAKGEGLWAVDMPIGGGKLSLEVNDLGANGDLASSADTDAVLLTGTGVKGDARYKLSVTLVPETQALTCLEVSLHAGNDLIFDTATVTSDQIISANDSVIASSSNIFADVEAANAISGGTYWGFRTPGVTPRTMPDPSTVFDYYVTNGTPIDITSLPKSGGYWYMDLQVLSPAANPYGSRQTNPQGIYVIDCLGLELAIQNCRIVGTLVVLNPGACEVYTVNWEPAVANFPSLLVSGNAEFYQNASGLLEEGSALSFNFNPPGTPYQGAEDTDTNDSYPIGVAGLVYVSGDFNTWQSPAFDGVVVVGNTMTGTLALTYRPTFLNNPPPGFDALSKMVVSPGTWKQVVD